jgi:hypothetical protein
MVSIPVLKIDEPMIVQGVKNFDRIGLIATNPWTLEPSRLLLETKANELDRKITLRPFVCEGAFDPFLQGHIDNHDRIIRENLLRLMETVDVVLLAQASMARVVDGLEEKKLRVPILSSPKTAVEHLAVVYRAKSERGDS